MIERFDLVVSTRTGAGLDGLIDRVGRMVSEGLMPAETPVITRARHREALERCREVLAESVYQEERALELRAEDLRRATDAIGRITGRVDAESVLDVIFSSFCIGK